MKYGVLMVKNTDNIGDDIQSYAALRFLPNVDYVLDRESLNTFGMEEVITEPVSVIMNGWFMYGKYNWPPSEKIHPLWISMHVSEHDYFNIGDRFLDDLGGDYLRHYAPIGARDNNTLVLFKRKGIEAYLSGCMTLTLEMPKIEERRSEICLVDLDAESVDLIKNKYPNENIAEITHNVPPEHSQKSAEERFEIAEQLLQRYQRAKCVVTSRLHCALPCLALGTPVLVLYKDEYQSRMGGFLEYLNYATRKNLGEVLSAEFDLKNPPANAASHLSIRQSLIETCERFIEMSKIEKNYMPFKVDMETRYVWQHKLMQTLEFRFRSEINHQVSWIRQLEEAKKYLNVQIENRDRRLCELDTWIIELEKSKAYLEQQVATKDARIAELEGWSQKAEEAKAYLETQVTAKDARIAELEDWSRKAEEAKGYLETQVTAKDARIAELEGWNQKAEEAKAYLETQVTAKDARIAELEDWSRKAEEAKGYLETQVTAKDARIAELEDWNQKAGEAKEYLETQVTAKDARIAELEEWCQKVDDAKAYLETQMTAKDARIAELENWIKELETAKEFLKEQWDAEIQSHEKEKQTITEMQEQLAERDNTISKQKYKLKLLLNDKNVQKIIIKKQYEI